MISTPILDVYAASFVPQALRKVNDLQPQISQGTPPRAIDYDKYLSTYAGSDFLSDHEVRRPRPDLLPAITPEDVSSLSLSSFGPHFQGLLSDESRALSLEADAHSLFQVSFLKSRWIGRIEMRVLSVPGLRESTLRIEVGDIVQLRQLFYGPFGQLINGCADRPMRDTIPTQQLNAFVWGIDRLNECLILNTADYPFYAGATLNVRFTTGTRSVALRQAVLTIQHFLEDHKGKVPWLRSMLFPDESDGCLQHSLNSIYRDYGHHDSMLNYEQMRAIDTVLGNEYGHVPFIISGPPGTGKTKTLVEMALQLLDANSDAHLLICASSDSAVDILVQRLAKHLSPNDLFRLQASSRSFPEVPGSLLPYCHVDDDIFSLPPFAKMIKYRIVATTCRDADMLVRAGLANADMIGLKQSFDRAFYPRHSSQPQQCHWSALLIDEAAQAIEPEALIPLTVVMPARSEHDIQGQLPIFVMAGDQNQLGPRTASRLGAIQVSLFERIAKRPFYAEHALSRGNVRNRGKIAVLTKDLLPLARPPFANLVKNYRSHPAILAMPSAMFYNDTLEPRAADTDSLLSWTGWKGRPGWPVMLVENAGLDEIEQEGGGWLNVQEADRAIIIAQSLIASGLIVSSDICIMAPFSAQVRLLRQKARQKSQQDPALRNLNIGPLEAFQGLESRLVILCTTRARDRFIEQDLKRGLGVMFEPRRLNVALTRAKQGLVVIGNPALLVKDEHWKQFLGFCYRNELVDAGGVKEADRFDPGSVYNGASTWTLLETQADARRRADEAGVGRSLGARVGMGARDEIFDVGYRVAESLILRDVEDEIGESDIDEGGDLDTHDEHDET